jgi:membrane protease subunit HflC
MNKWSIHIVIGIVVVLLFLLLCSTVIYQGRTAVLMCFGKPVKVITEPGIYLRFPYPIHRVEKIDSRLSLLEPRPSEFLTSDKKNLILENSVCYRIVDPIKYMRTVRDMAGLEIRLTDLLSSHTGLLLGVRELSDLVNIDTSKIRYREMNEELTQLMKRDAADMGVEIDRVFIKRIMLPYENTLAVYDRMRAERDRIAKKYIAEGEEKALQIRAEADKTSRTLLAEAEKQAAIIKGQAEANAMKTYAQAYQKNEKFYRFLRSLEAYEKMFNDQTVIILDEDSPILETLFSGAGHGNQ